MDVNAWRAWGIVVSAALMIGALIIASPWREPASAAASLPLYQLAQTDAAPAPPAPVSFVVRFRGDGPIARAQALAGRGGETQGARQVQAQLERQHAFHGLCFDRFTLGAAEIVLRSCADIAPAERAAFQTRWLVRLNAMRAVDYADANTTAAPARAPR
jgi:hypothetical protein